MVRIVACEQATGVEDTLDAGAGVAPHTRHVGGCQWMSRMERRHRARALGDVHASDHERVEV